MIVGEEGSGLNPHGLVGIEARDAMRRESWNRVWIEARNTVRGKARNGMRSETGYAVRGKPWDAVRVEARDAMRRESRNTHRACCYYPWKCADHHSEGCDD